MADRNTEDFGALVGWTTTRTGDRVTLRMQSVDRPPPHKSGDVHSHFYVLDENQAVQLGNTLFEITDQTKPDRKGRGLLVRLSG